MILKLGIKHQAMELYKVYINHDLGMTVDLDLFYGKVNIGCLCIIRMGKLSKMLFNGGKLAGSMQMDRRFMVMKKKCPQVVVCPCPGAIYMYMTIIFKDLLL